MHLCCAFYFCPQRRLITQFRSGGNDLLPCRSMSFMICVLRPAPLLSTMLLLCISMSIAVVTCMAGAPSTHLTNSVCCCLRGSTFTPSFPIICLIVSLSKRVCFWVHVKYHCNPCAVGTCMHNRYMIPIVFTGFLLIDRAALSILGCSFVSRGVLVSFPSSFFSGNTAWEWESHMSPSPLCQTTPVPLF